MRPASAASAGQTCAHCLAASRVTNHHRSSVSNRFNVSSAPIRYGRAHGARGRCLLGLSLALCPLLQAQYHFDFWTADQGLPQNIVRDVHQTADGYLWIATLDGLARFDGVRFSVFNTSSSPGISTNRFTSLYEAAGGALWAGAENGDVTRYQGGVFTTYSTQNGLPGSLVRGITGDQAGHLWVLSRNQILTWADGKFVRVAAPHFPGGSRLSFYVVEHSRRGGFWSGGSGWTFRFRARASDHLRAEKRITQSQCASRSERPAWHSLGRYRSRSGGHSDRPRCESLSPG